MIRLIRVLLLSIHFFISSFIGLLIGIVRPFHPTNSRWCAAIYSSLAMPILGIKREVEGWDILDQSRPCIVVANHQSNWDLFIVGGAVPDRTVSLGKKSLKLLPIFGQLYWLAGNVLIDRGNPHKAKEAMEITKQALTQKNTSIWIFPEGTRNQGKNLLPFKKGAFITAINAGVPIVPVCCSSYLDHFSLGQLNNGVAKIKVLPAVSTQGLKQKDAAQLMHTIEADMLRTIQALDGKAAPSADSVDNQA
ncbi:1-acylglycerol-3-phosphate O-acyltransferase [Oceaniserpentilla sp. 4NH20-0058]|uniref:lysophospholipid acyltransferase family protein n=1 Tax=Oceaniserpentilla sp. 4NH20-0058 TaxID=3127660 RepID=UPI003107A382